MKTYLVTGGNGFIGANLVRSLLEKNKEAHPPAKVIVLTEPNANLWRLENIRDDIGIVECDITDRKKVAQIISLIKPSVIFHLAALGVKPENDGIRKLFDVNFFGTVNLLEACKKTGFECFVTTGTASEYGCKKTSLKETCMLEPQDDYSISKAATTLYCKKEAKLHNLPIYTIRPFCAYGDFEPPHRLIPTIVTGFLQNKPICLSTPHAVRDFVYVKDIADGYLSIAKHLPDTERIFNIGTGKQRSIQEIVTTMEQIFKSPLKISWNASEPRPWEFTNWQANVQRTRSILHWKPAHTLKAGLRKTVAWFKNNMSPEHAP